jgi:hypothetical protein
MKMRFRLSRRHVLRSLGASVGLPFLECMAPRTAWAAPSKPPVRLVWLYAGSGMFMPAYKPARTGREWHLSTELPDTQNSFKEGMPEGIKPLGTLEPLLPLKDHVTLLSGLYHPGAFTRGTVVRHAQDPMCHLTGADLFRVPGVACRNSVSIDQVAARQVGPQTRLPVLNLTHDRGLTVAASDTGSPIPSDWNPYDIFQRLFTGPSDKDKAWAEVRFLQRKSILDDCMDDAKALLKKLGKEDHERFEEYLSQLRSIETRAEATRKWAGVPLPMLPQGAGELKKIGGVGQSLDLGNPQAAAAQFKARIRLLLDVLVLALQTDQTRIATATLGHMGDVYKEEGLHDTYHGYTHTGPAGMAKVDRLRIEHVAYFLERLQGVKEADGSTLLDNSLVHFGGGMGTWHESTDLANFVAGHAGGRLKLGDHVDFQGKPLANLYVAMLQAAGIEIDRFADSTGPLPLA